MDAVPSMLEYIVRGAASAVLPMNLLVMFLGLIVGIVGGMLPGITTVTAVALFVPFTFSMPPDMALIGSAACSAGPCTAGPTPPSSSTRRERRLHRHHAGRLSPCLTGQGRRSLLHRPARFGPRRHFRNHRAHAVLRAAVRHGPEVRLRGLLLDGALRPVHAGGDVPRQYRQGAARRSIGLALCTVGLDPVMGMPRFTFGCFELVQGLDMVAS